jgi:hypothetical protein
MKKQFTGLRRMLVIMLTFGSVVFSCASSGAKYSSFDIGNRKIDLYALLESCEEPRENWQLLSINVVKTSNDGKYIAIGSTEKGNARVSVTF